MHQFDDAETMSLEVIDATLAGEAVEPEHAELAELTLILAGLRPMPSPAYAAALDDRVARRFTIAPSAGARRPRRRWLYAPGAAVAVAAAAAAAIVLTNTGSQQKPVFASAGALSSPVRANAGSGASSHAAPPNGVLKPATKALRNAPPPVASGLPKAASSSGSATFSQNAPASAGSLSDSPTIPAPASAGRQIVQSAQLQLSTRPSRVDSVAQQVFNVISAQGGVVQNSNVTAANNSNGYAQFQLSVPSANLSQTMGDLSRLHGASVVSRTDATQDITGQVGGAGRRLADARALRTSLLRQLERATTTTEIDSLRIQIRDAEASISSDEATLNSLHHRVDFSQISLTINTVVLPVHPVSSGGSFTLGRAVHDAGRVLVVAAGVSLITLAALVPVAMVAAIVLWLAYAIRRRRREQVLDLV